MALHRNMLFSAASFAVLALSPAVAASAECTPVTEAAGFDLLIEVEGVQGEFRLVCRSGRLLAVPLAAGQAAGTAGGAPAAAPGPSEPPAADPREAATTKPGAAPTGSDTAEAGADAAVEAMEESAASVEQSGAELGEVPEELGAPGSGETNLPAASAEPETAGSAIEAAINDSAEEAVEELGAERQLPAGSPPEVTADSTGDAEFRSPASDADADADEQTARNAAGVADRAAEAASQDEVSSDGSETARNAAGVAGQAPSRTVVRSGDEPPDQTETARNGAGVAGEAPGTAGAAGVAPDIAVTGSGDGPSLDRAEETARNAAGVGGRAPDATIAEAGDDASADRPTMEPAMGPAADADAAKPSVSAADAAPAGEPAGPGDDKDEDRIGRADGRDMVPVPVLVIANARLALPGVSFKSVALSGEDEGRIYALSGEAASGRDVAVDVDPSGKILQVDRQVATDEVPERVLRIALALVPEASLDRVMLSNRENYQTFFVFSGRDEGGQPFELEIRADGRDVEFLRDS